MLTQDIRSAYKARYIHAHYADHLGNTYISPTHFNVQEKTKNEYQKIQRLHIVSRYLVEFYRRSISDKQREINTMGYYFFVHRFKTPSFSHKKNT
jgi:hypothetical protein